MIEPLKNERGVSRAKAICDMCGKDEVVAADVDTKNGTLVANEGQVVRKLTAQKWSLVKGRLHCPICTARRKAAQTSQATTTNEPTEVEMTVKESALRQPTARMTAQIVGLLEDAYDDKAKRYRNPADTDKSLAEVIGGGCLWGWVAAIRESDFGPDTRNAEIEAIRAEVNRLDGVMGNLLGEVRKVEAAQSALRMRLEKAA